MRGRLDRGGPAGKGRGNINAVHSRSRFLCLAYLAEGASADTVGLTLGAAMAINQLGIIAAPPLLGLVHDLTGAYAALWACIVVVLVAAYALTRLKQKPRSG